MRFLLLVLLSVILFSCEHKEPPLPGKRINVLHYDLLESESFAKIQIKLPTQMNAQGWNLSDVGQFTGLPGNISLPKDIKQSKESDSFKIANSSTFGAAIVITSDVAYSYNNTTLSAYNIATGKNLWKANPVAKKERSGVLGGSIAYFNNVIYLSSGGRDFIAFNASDGKELWRYRLPNVVNSIPLISNGQIYLISTDNKISCLDMKGQLLWRYNAAIYSLTTSRLYVPGVIYADKVIVFTTAGDLAILNRHDGSEIAGVSLATEGVIGDGSLAKGPIASPYLDKDKIYVLTGESELIKIDMANPGIVWRQVIPNAKSLWVAGNATYVLTENDQLIALENTQGKMVWINDLSQYYKKNKIPILYGPLLAGDQVIVTSANGDLFTICPYTGKLLLQNKTGLSFSRMPIIANKKLYLIGANGKVSIWN